MNGGEDITEETETLKIDDPWIDDEVEKKEDPIEEDSPRVHPRHRFKVENHIVQLIGGDPETFMAKMMLGRLEVSSDEVQTTDHFSFAYFMEKASKTAEDNFEVFGQRIHIAFMYLLEEFLSEKLGYRLLNWDIRNYSKAFINVFYRREDFSLFNKVAIEITKGDRENMEECLKKLTNLKTILYENVDINKLKEGVKKFPKIFEKTISDGVVEKMDEPIEGPSPPCPRFQVENNEIELKRGDPETFVAMMTLGRLKITPEDAIDTSVFSFDYFWQKAKNTPEEEAELFCQRVHIAFMYLLTEFLKEKLNFRLLNWDVYKYIEPFIDAFQHTDELHEFHRMALDLTKEDALTQISVMCHKKNAEKCLEKLMEMKTILHERVNIGKLAEEVVKLPLIYEKIE